MRGDRCSSAMVKERGWRSSETPGSVHALPDQDRTYRERSRSAIRAFISPISRS